MVAKMCYAFFMNYPCNSHHYEVLYHRCEENEDIELDLDECDHYVQLNHQSGFTCTHCLTDWDNYPAYATPIELTGVDFESKTEDLLGRWIFLQGRLGDAEYFHEDYANLINPLDIHWLKFSRQCVENSLRALMGNHPELRPGAEGNTENSRDLTQDIVAVTQAFMDESIKLLTFLQASIEYIVFSNSMHSHAIQQRSDEIRANRAARAYLPFFVLQYVSLQLLPSTLCRICRVPLGTSPAPLEPGDEVIPPEYPVSIPRCGHVFGRRCIENWLEQAQSCPACRMDLHEHFLFPSDIGTLPDEPGQEIFEPTPSWIRDLRD